MDIIFDPSLALYLKLYEPDGAAFMSAERRGNPCSVTGAAWTPHGRTFDGIDDKLSLPAGIAPAGSADRTIELWCKATDVSNTRALFSYGSYSPGAYFMLRSSSANGALQFISHTINFFPSGMDLKPLVCHHITVSIKEGQEISLYLDTYKMSATLSGQLNTSDTEMDIGVDRRTPEAWWLGLISEFRIYNRVLTSQEINHNYLATKWRYK